jgi:hypothetical protein
MIRVGANEPMIDAKDGAPVFVDPRGICSVEHLGR